MLRAEHTFVALQRTPVQRQGRGSVAQRLQTERQIAHADERVRMLRAEHTLTAFQPTPVRRQGRGRVAGRL